VNEPLSFITFIAAHPLGSEVDATIESFSSHGAFADVEGARCYVPLSAMGNPPPKSAREVLGKGDTVRFVIQALDPQRRGIELALPGFAKVAGAPTEETVEAEITSASEEPAAETASSRQLVPAGAETDNGRVRPAAGGAAQDGADGAPAKRGGRARPAKKAPAGAPGEAAGGTRKKAAKKASPVAEKAPAKKAPGKKAPARRAAAKKTTAVAESQQTVPTATSDEPATTGEPAAAAKPARRRTTRAPAKEVTPPS
jgi:hypothetical protein